MKHSLSDLVMHLETIDEERRERVLLFHRNEKTGLEHKALEKVMTFEDIIALSDAELSILISELKIEVLLRAIITFEIFIRNRFLKFLSLDQKKKAKEFFDSYELDSIIAESSQREIVGLLRKLEIDGKINIDPKKSLRGVK